MALYKEMMSDDNVPLTYHRIARLSYSINSHIDIDVFSYMNQQSRIVEVTEDKHVYKKAVTYEIDYVPDMTIEDAYSYLKTLPEFEGATDI